MAENWKGVCVALPPLFTRPASNNKQSPVPASAAVTLSVCTMAKGRHLTAVAQSTLSPMVMYAAGTVHTTWSRATDSGKVKP